MGVRLDQYTLATNPAFIGIVTAGLMQAREYVLIEDTQTPNHVNRLVFANTALAELGAEDRPMTTRFVWLVALNPTIRAVAVIDGVVLPESVVDSDVDYVIAANIDNVVGTD